MCNLRRRYGVDAHISNIGHGLVDWLRTVGGGVGDRTFEGTSIEDLG
jgi:hypothetical protein